MMVVKSMVKTKSHAKKICFISPGAYSLLVKKNADNMVGPDIHQFILAKELIKYNFEITFITYGSETSVEFTDNIKIIKIREKTSKAIKAINICNAMKNANADIYFHAGGVPGIISLFCQLPKKRFVYHISSDALVNKKIIKQKVRGFSRLFFNPNTFGNWLDIKLADTIIVQSQYQKDLLKKNFDKDGFLIKMPFPLTEQEMPKKANPPIVLWVGSMSAVKQPELFVKLAEAIPEARFQMIGGHAASDQKLYSRIKESSKRILNFESLGVIPFNEINEYFSQASILVNTSMFEGFPNSFIQAWMNYTPVVSLNADPDEIISRYKMGFHSKTFSQLVEDVRLLLGDEHLHREMGENGRRYVEKEHDITKIVGEYVGMFNEM